jgi:hypothetical protein
MRRFLRATTALGVVLLGLASSTRAAKPTAKKSKEPELPAPDVKLRIEQRPGDYWVMELSNPGTVPLRVDADARLLRLEITPPASVSSAPPPPPKKNEKKKKVTDDPNAPFTCELPSTMRVDGRHLVLPPGGRYLEAFDPRLYCLDRSSRIVEGATIVARLGWTPPKTGALKPPFVVGAPPVPFASASASASVLVASAKEIGALAVVVKPRVAPIPPPVIPSTTAKAVTSAAPSTSASASGSPKKPPPPPPPPPPPKVKSPLVARAGAARSILAEKYADVTFTMRNEGAETVTVYARPQLLSAFVRGPRGLVQLCEGFKVVPAPIIDFVTKLKPGGTWSSTISLASVCPPGTFDYPGLYEVTPILHTQPIANVPTAIVSDVIPEKPQLLRIEEGKKPFHDALPFVLVTSE